MRASVRSVTFLTVIAFSVGATAASNANSSVNATAARMLSRRENQRPLAGVAPVTAPAALGVQVRDWAA